MGARALGLVCAGLLVVTGCERSLERVGEAPEPGAGGAGGEGLALAERARQGRPPGVNDVRVMPPAPPRVEEDDLSGTVRGKVSYVGPETVVVDDPHGRRFWLRLRTNSVVLYRGRPASVLMFEHGALVDATFVTDNSEKVLTRANVLRLPDEPPLR